MTTFHADYAAPPRGSLAAFVSPSRRLRPPLPPPIKFTGRTEAQDSFVSYPQARPPPAIKHALPPQSSRAPGFDAESEYRHHYRRWPLDKNPQPCQPPPSSIQGSTNLPFSARTTAQDDFGQPPPAALLQPSVNARHHEQASRRHVPENRTFKTAKDDYRAPPADFCPRAAAAHVARVHIEPEQQLPLP